MAKDESTDIAAIATDLDRRSRDRRGHVGSSSLNERLMAFAMADPAFKTQLFRFVDVFPATGDDADVVEHLREYLAVASPPRLVRAGLSLQKSVPFGTPLTARLARRAITRMARQFIAGSDPDDALGRLFERWQRGIAFTVDVLGEKTVSDDDAERYARRVDALLTRLVEQASTWPSNERLESDDRGPIPRINVSVKPTALSARYTPLTRDEGLEEAATRLRPILRRAREHGALVNFDMEHVDVKDMTLDLVRALLDEEEFASLDFGVAVQAYLKDARSDLASLIESSARRSVPLTVRLVKGAYWDTESVRARAENWPIPVFERKTETDASYEACTRLLHDHHSEIRAAFGSHNLRSIAHAVASARERGIPDDGYEFQMLYGMAEPIHDAVAQSGFRVRVYAPVGELVPGMAYLVRRLLENTANESFVRARMKSATPLSELLEAPPAALAPSEAPARRGPTDPAAPGDYEPEPPAEWHRGEVRAAFAAQLSSASSGLGAEIRAVIDGEEVATSSTIASVDPAHPGRVVALQASCGTAEADAAVDAARRAYPAWRDTAVDERAAVLFRAAEWMRRRRNEIAALEVYEAGKPWAEADGDVCESIDYCEYYARRMLRLAAGGPVESPPGEENALFYEPRGVGVVIPPWNFPLAIPTGMTVAALVSGNAVVLKPAEQTPAVAAVLVRALSAAGLPPGVLNLVPGVGEVVGAHLVAHPGIAFVAFTGSKAVGLSIIEQAAIHRPGQRQIKRVVAEMGGKNPLIIDADADIDQAVPIAVVSAFSYSGQKCSACSRVIVVGHAHDEFVARLAGSTKRLSIGDPTEMATEIGPLIDEEAYKRVAGWVERAGEFGDVVVSRADVPDDGFFVGPTIVDRVRTDSPLWREEIFGPLLCVVHADSFDEAIELANDTDYALTAGIVSRSPAHVAVAKRRLRAGNVYVNRTITGAVVGRHPFGGFGLSGVGSKAGGPDYLLWFLEPRATSENTVRQGFAPDTT